MNKSILIYIIITLCFFSISLKVNSQEFNHNGINLGVKIGGSRLLCEIKKDFSGVINEFNNKIGFASAFEISKYIAPKWEIAASVSYTVLNGNTYSPEFSAEGIQYGIPSEINDPVEYKNKLLGFNFFFRYYFKTAGSESAFIPFVTTGGGYLNYNSIFKYIDTDEDELIFGKGNEGLTHLSTPVFFVGTGFKTNLSSNFHLITSLDFNMVDYDFLDVMHNYNTDKERLKIIGLYTEFKIGIFYRLNFSKDKKNGQNKNKLGRNTNSGHLPFSR